MWIGLDFGTTNTVVSTVDRNGIPRALPLDPLAPNPGVVRTMLYVERDHTIRIGADAISSYFRQNVGRVPRYTRKWIGMIDIEIGDVVVKGYEINAGPTAVDIFADVDADAPGRLLHALKGPLATDYAGTTLFGRYFTLEDLIATFLAELRVRAERLLGEPITGAVVGRPVIFANAVTEHDSARAQQRLENAAHQAGFEHIRFVHEPVAAAAAGPAGAGPGLTFVFDFGGGTLDVALLAETEPGESTVLATGGLGLAGDHFDQEIFRRVLLPWFGGDVRWGEQSLAVPAHLLAALGDWQDVPTLCRPEVLGFLREAQTGCSDPVRLHALEDLIFKGHAYAVYERVEKAKVELSSRRFTAVSYRAGAIDVWQPLTRGRLEDTLAGSRRAVAQLLADTLERGNAKASDVRRVLRTGGSSSIPCFIELLAGEFGRESLVDWELFTGVASGLAVNAARMSAGARKQAVPAVQAASR